MNRYRVFIATLGLMLGGATCLSAQWHRAEVFGGYSYAKINPEAALPKENASGWMGGAAGYANRWFGAGFEIASQFGNMATPGGAAPAGIRRLLQEPDRNRLYLPAVSQLHPEDWR